MSRKDYASAREFLKEHSSLKEIVHWVRSRFSDITKNLREEEINKHDLSHQLRTAYNGVNIMQALGEDYFTHRETILAGIAAVIHDVGYIDGDTEDIEEKGYNSGNKGKYKKHALKGANEVKRKLNQYLKLVNGAYGDRVKIDAEKVEEIRKMLTYKDENGEDRLINDKDIEFIWGSILHHNDYGKDTAEYNPWMVDPSALIVQLCDKLDHCRQRIYKEHLNPEDFVPDHERTNGSERDDKYFHRSVPYCIQDYKFLVNEKNGRMTWVANVDLNRFNELMKDVKPNYYTPDSFAKDFHTAYEKSARVAAEALGAILHQSEDRKPLKEQTQYLDIHSPLVVELQFSDGNKKRLYYTRPDRDIYSSKSLAPWQEELFSAYEAAEEMRLVDKGESREKAA
ncbi:HD domain-containing protein [Candidatus Pacearchaeota archaeon]|nr:HD domain-containing protein [Candidatus Pacearchaeota archaeon]